MTYIDYRPLSLYDSVVLANQLPVGGSDKAISQHSQHCLIRFCKPPKTKRTFHGGHGRHKRHKRHKRGPIKAERGAE